MKIVTSFLESVAGIEQYPVISFLIFLLFFAGVTWYVISLDRKFVREVSEYPLLEEDESLQNNSRINKHN